MKQIDKRALPFEYMGNSAKGCLLIHGFSGSPADMRPLGNYLKKRGYGVRALLLPGHGTKPQDLALTDWQTWYLAVETEYLKMSEDYKEVVPIGFSLGALLALYLSVKQNASQVISLNTPLFFRNEEYFVLKNPDCEYLSKQRSLAEKKRNQLLGRFSYEEIPVKAFQSLLEFKELLKTQLAKIKIPVLVVQTKNDGLVNPISAQFLYDSIKSKRKKLVWLEKAEHLLTFSDELPLVLEEIALFLAKSSGN
ncbi:MAG TPA: alpha/beta fold hydrolase [Clostridia bacterium]|nr:alpha/beta fold hydrolase [Clostridia bacterium]